MTRTISYTCPVCAGTMLETEAMEQERLSEVERLREACDFLVAALQRVQTRPSQESAWIAVVNLQEANKRFGVQVGSLTNAEAN